MGETAGLGLARDPPYWAGLGCRPTVLRQIEGVGAHSSAGLGVMARLSTQTSRFCNPYTLLWSFFGRNVSAFWSLRGRLSLSSPNPKDWGPFFRFLAIGVWGVGGWVGGAFFSLSQRRKTRGRRTGASRIHSRLITSTDRPCNQWTMGK